MNKILFSFFILTSVLSAQWQVDSTFPALPSYTRYENIFKVSPDSLVVIEHYIYSPPPSEAFIIYVKNIIDTTWTLLYNGTPIGDSFCYVNSKLAFAATFYLMKTVDGGISWQQIYDFGNSEPHSSVTDIYFRDEQNGYVTGGAGGQGFLGRTDDGGLSWYFQTIPFPGFCRNLVLLNDSTFLVSEQYNGTEKIYKSSDYGYTWTIKNSNSFNTILKLYFFDEENGWALGTSGNILKTNDAGENWEDVSPGSIDTYTDCYFFSNNYGWVTGYNSVIHTSNGGTTWENLLDINQGYDSHIIFMNPDTGYVITWYQGYKTTNGGGFPTEVQSFNSSLKNFSLSQNYPNPFNPTTNIQYQIPNREFVTLKVYDILGNEVATLVNEEKPTGSYSVNFDAGELSSGIYFYRLTAGDFGKTKKLLLLK